LSSAQGKHSEASSNWSDAALDVAAAFIPYIPAGATKVAKAGRAAEKAAATAKGTARWTNNNYRRGLQMLTGKTGAGFEAHHALPQKFEKFFKNLALIYMTPNTFYGEILINIAQKQQSS